MGEIFIFGLALFPFLILVGLILFRKWSVLKAMPIALLVLVIAMIFVWKLSGIVLLGASVKGALLSVEIMLIITGAVWIIELLKDKNQIRNIRDLLSNVSEDIRIQSLLIGWLFVSLIEGVAGFGTPAALAAPLLVSLGLSPIISVIISLIGNSTAVSFGAAGTPMLLGLGGSGFTIEVIKDVSKEVVLLHAIGSIIIPLAIVFFVISSIRRKGRKKLFFEILPFALFSWFAFIIPYSLFAIFVGLELPSIAGGLIGIIVFILMARVGFLVPRNKVKVGKSSKRFDYKKLKSLIPYFLIIILLTFTRVVPFIKGYLTGIEISLLDYKFLPLYTPSFYFILSGIFFVFVFGFNLKELKRTVKNAFNKVKLATLALIFTLIFVQIMISSGINNSGLKSIPLVLVENSIGVLGKFFVFVSPFIGVFGSFIAGSNTVSNLLFGVIQSEAAHVLGVSLISVLALQVVGGAIGNMIALHNVIAASSTVGLYGVEWKIIRKTIFVSLLYSLIVGVFGFILIG